ncbi:AMP-dependent synthetase and ligase [uncultured Woeseiaceae bacterium]|uniref:AMP-dependent synthetase and ligase n=1 Tax=uncultured Woeseiaceae bacterium TaxID=1983305 RepID=A0A7D9D1J1_9GAMM|nr:AMP-dependent synthetase and ligase [uncultured Woeseiaceae bacterium]
MFRIITMTNLLTAHQALVDWAEQKPDRVFLNQPVDGIVRTFTWGESADASRRMASALLGLGLKPGETVAILAKNSAEWMLADIAISMAGLISVPIYPTAGPHTISHVLQHSGARAVFVGKLDDAESVASALPADLPKIAFPYPTVECQHQWQELLERHEPLQALHDPAQDDIMTILYTSGSTGQPKGVVISYGAYAYGCEAARSSIDVGPADHLFSYLPLAHITERTVTAGPAIYGGCECSFVESLETFPRDLKRASPTVFISVPRLWVKFQSGVHAKISPAKLKLLLALPIVGKAIARKIRNELGFVNCRSYGSGSAPISPLTLKWYERLGVNIGEGWGMSETSGLSCGNVPFTADRLGTIGVPVAGTEMKLSNEGPGLLTEYFRQLELTRKVFTEDGFFHTGDRAEWDELVQAYRITGRVKDIFKSAKGKYVTPVPIESRLSGNPLLEQVCVMGSGLPAPLAVVVLSEAAQNVAKKDIKSSLQTTLHKVNARVESHERMSNIIIVNDEWTTENDLLTPTLKLKRNKLEEKYKLLIARQFSEQIVWEG